MSCKVTKCSGVPGRPPRSRPEPPAPSSRLVDQILLSLRASPAVKVGPFASPQGAIVRRRTIEVELVFNRDLRHLFVVARGPYVYVGRR